MNIAVFAKRTTFHEGYGGMETQNKILCEGLVKRGHKVTIFSPDWGISLGKKEENGVNYVFVKSVYRMGPVFGFFGTMQKRNWINRSYEAFQEIHAKQPFELVLAQSSTGLGLIRKKSEHGLPIVSISHGTIIGEYKTFINSMSFPKDLFKLLKNTGFTLKNFFRRQRDFVNGSERVIAVSDFVRQAILDETFTNDDRIVVVNNGIDPAPFFPQDTKLNRGNRMMYVGKVIKSKGLEDIIEMFHDERFKGLELDVFGDGEFFEEMKERVANDENIVGKINLPGKLQSGEELRDEYYKSEDYGAFVLPTKRAEGLPMVLIEAMFSGIPAVVYDNGGVGDGVDNGKTGFLVKADDLDSFKDKVLQIVGDQKLRNEFSKASLKIAYEKFTLEKMLDRYENVFMGVLNENS